METVALTTMDSPVGELTVAAHGERVCLVHFGSASPGIRSKLKAWYPEASIQQNQDPGGAVTVLNRYFCGDLSSLDDLAVELHGTDFQRSVWTALRSVRVGTT